MRAFHLFEKSVYSVAIAGFFVGALSMILMMFHIGADVIARTVFNSPIIGTIEIVSAWYMVGVIFPPLALIQLYAGHIVVELFTQSASARAKAFLETAVGAVAIIFLTGWTNAAIKLALRKTAQNETLDVVFFEVLTWPTRWILALSLLTLTLAFLVTTFRAGHLLLTGRPLSEPISRFGFPQDEIEAITSTTETGR
ncbi:TRAP transporter small permease [Thalassovita taeanensis]|uniref:TRAP transporter small permease protein n=1 Tax=Thalassovita taeanensis TaxID=657014 RepID=A0A1H9H7G7_9RHOB|nr:TRAP transporter small permease subunit [Thalassovita taeanensis]SEQ58256.1 TRAP-type C4-dicarboxylate transport system, small permease component [Thalassovita taeanensis]